MEIVLTEDDGKYKQVRILDTISEMTFIDPFSNELIELDFDPNQERAYLVSELSGLDIKNKIVLEKGLKKVYTSKMSFLSMINFLKSK